MLTKPVFLCHGRGAVSDSACDADCCDGVADDDAPPILLSAMSVCRSQSMVDPICVRVISLTMMLYLRHVDMHLQRAKYNVE